MTTRELLEHANLAALGLLDQAEHAEYERALARAPLPIRKHVLAEQERWSSGGELLPAVEPPAHMRDRVLDAVRGAMVDAEIAQSAGLMDLPGSRRVHAAWRAGALGLLCASVALASVVVLINRSQNISEQTQNSIAADESLEKAFGHAFVNDIAFADTKRVTFALEDKSFGGRLALFTNDSWEDWRVFSADMPVLASGERYALVELKDDGEVAQELASFGGHTQRQNHAIKPVKAGSRIALVVATGAMPTAEKLLMVATIA